MNISDTRRKRLKAWFLDRPIPAKEKSYVSQLLTGKASFGEKAARRLEKTYQMGEMWLDQVESEVSDGHLAATHIEKMATSGFKKPENVLVLTKEQNRIISSLNDLSKEGLAAVLVAIESAKKLYPKEKTKKKDKVDLPDQATKEPVNYTLTDINLDELEIQLEDLQAYFDESELLYPIEMTDIEMSKMLKDAGGLENNIPPRLRGKTIK